MVSRATSNRANKAAIFAVLGASGSGKTSHVMAELRKKKPGRLLVWDTKGEFAREQFGERVADIVELVGKVRAAGTGRFALCYQPRGRKADMVRQFDVFCLLAFHAKGLHMIAEELSDVTTASAAPEGWRKVTTQGRTEGLTIYGLSQSPAQIDKDFFGNCSKVRTGRLNFDSHIKALSNCLSVPAEEIRNLLPGQFVERDMLTGAVYRGRVF